jgi:NAD(P)-dependent dehydrogenase (short-subunit alcohol dehydrogenase family)
MKEASMRVVITGGNRGLGLELARAYERAGADVVVGCRDPLSAPVGRAHRLDLGDESSIGEFVAFVGDDPVDVLVNNAGIDARSVGVADSERDVMALSDQHFLEVMRVNAVGPMLLTRALAPNLRAAGHAKVVNISSQVGSMEVAQRMGRDVSYTASKAALNMISIKLAQALSADGVVVVAMHPGYLRTAMGGASADTAPDEAAASIVHTVAALGPEHSASFIRWDGSIHPW